MSGMIRLSGVTVNAPDAIKLARFYADVTGGVAKGSTHWGLPAEEVDRIGRALTVSRPKGAVLADLARSWSLPVTADQAGSGTALVCPIWCTVQPTT